jgi:ATP-dependent Lhr-like helicase
VDLGGATAAVSRIVAKALKTAPALAVPPPYDKRAWPRDEALVEIVRGRLEGLGPVGADALARPLGLTSAEVEVPLAALEAEGFAMRGRFTPEAAAEEWCERRLLSRIHHYTLMRLRAEIEPVAARDFLRFLFSWQHVSADARMAGLKALDRVVAQLEGFEAPAAAWESEILAARLAGYEPAWLDERCLAGHIAWMRLRPRNGRTNGGGRPAPVRTTPITLLPRRHTGIWTSLTPRDAAAHPSPRAQLLADCIKEHGASFFDELMDVSGLLRSQVEEALAELVAPTASYSGGCWNVRPRGCRRGASCSASIAGSKVAAKSAAAALSPASRASSSRCPRRSECCEQRGGSRRPINGSLYLGRIL